MTNEELKKLDESLCKERKKIIAQIDSYNKTIDRLRWAAFTLSYSVESRFIEINN